MCVSPAPGKVRSMIAHVGMHMPDDCQRSLRPAGRACSICVWDVCICIQECSCALLQCAVNTLCNITIPLKIQNALALLTDYCSIIAECTVCA